MSCPPATIYPGVTVTIWLRSRDETVTARIEAGVIRPDPEKNLVRTVSVAAPETGGRRT
jgi:hypothetical protein